MGRGERGSGSASALLAMVGVFIIGGAILALGTFLLSPPFTPAPPPKANGLADVYLEASLGPAKLMVTEGNVRAIYAVLKLNIYNENGKVKVSVKEIKTKGSYLLHMVLSSGRPYQVTGSISQERASSLNIISAPGETQWSIPIVLELQKGYPVREAKAYGQITVHIVLELEELATGSKQTRVVSTSASIEDHWRVS